MIPPCEYLSVEVDANIVTVELNRPPVNAVSVAMYREIHHVFSTLDQWCPSARVVVLSGRGRHFCAGNDLAEFATMTSENARERMFHVREAFWSIYSCSVPVIAAVHGAALGTGLALAASCDFIVASGDAKFGTPEVGVGIMGAARHLSRLLPQGLTRMLYYTAEPIGPERLREFGSVVEIVAREGLQEATLLHARQIARHSPVILRAAKRALTTVEEMNLRHGYEFEQGLTVELADHPHSREARRAALARDEPDYDRVGQFAISPDAGADAATDSAVQA
jgi:enoyl-CoA hydratase